MNIEMNFVEDLRAMYAARLQAFGYSLPATTGDLDQDTLRICVDHWNAVARRIAARPRTVHWSRELTANEPSLPSDIRTGLAATAQELRDGTDVMPRLSKKVRDRSYNDAMLHDWAIHHLHLGAAVRPNGLQQRTGDVLFVMVRDDDAYLVDVRDHDSFADDQLVEIIHSNWPETIRGFRLVGVGGMALTLEQRQNLRSKNANAGVQTADGTFYVAMGGGMVAAGNNFRAIRWADMTLATARSLEDSVRGLDALALADEVATATGARPLKLELRLGEIESDHALLVVANATTLEGNPFVIRVNYN